MTTESTTTYDDDPLERLEAERERREQRDLVVFLVAVVTVTLIGFVGFVFLVITTARAAAAEPLDVTVACSGKYVAFTSVQPAGGERLTYTALSGPGKNITFNVTNTPSNGSVSWASDVGTLVEANSYDVDYRITRVDAQGAVIASTVLRTPTCHAPKLVTTPTTTIAPERESVTLLPAVTLKPAFVVEIPFREPYE